MTEQQRDEWIAFYRRALEVRFEQDFGGQNDPLLHTLKREVAEAVEAHGVGLDPSPLVTLSASVIRRAFCVARVHDKFSIVKTVHEQVMAGAALVAFSFIAGIGSGAFAVLLWWGAGGA
jgi:hypothetical protein